MPTLGDVMTKNVVVARSSAGMDSVRRLMVQHKISRVVIVNEISKPVGIITDKDLLRYALTEESKDLDELIAYHVMSKPLVKESEATSLPSCAKRMLESAISSVVVVSEDTLVGIVTKTDLCRFYAVNIGKSEGVQKRMTAKPITAHSGQRVRDAVRIMVENNISRVPIVNGQLEGIITISDLTAINPALSPVVVMAKSKTFSVKGKIVLPKDVGLITIGDVMTRNPITILDDAYLSDAAKSMIDHHISGLPVVNAKNLLEGIITKTDVVKAVAAMQ
jgi:CBS domain-containing protein